MFFLVITKNLNWEILAKNLGTFKRCNGVSWKFIGKSEYTGESIKSQYIGEGGGELAKKGSLDSLQI